ncbi:MAG: replicative DNA helicase [Thiotrichaceae bacterium]|nr:MAG: replicative DNA helicase [Thiotrichaceae bacterium]
MDKNNKIDILNKLPSSIEAEEAVIGGLILDNQSWEQIADILTPQDFYFEENKNTFSCIYELSEENVPFDIVTISKKYRNISDKDISLYLTNVVKKTPTAANIKAYADIVREQSILRQLIQIGRGIIEDSYNGLRDSKTLLDEAEKKIFNIADDNLRLKTGFQQINKLVKDSYQTIEELSANDNPVTGIATGFKEFDEKTTGLHGGDLIIVAGRPSMGKTTFAMNLAEYASLKCDSSVAIFSMEMGGNQLSSRFISSIGRINQLKIRTGKLSDDDWPRVTQAVSLLSKAKIFIDDTPALNPNDIRARSRRLMRENGLDMIIIDYLQLMQVSGSTENRATEISEISRSLKALARELNVPVVALSQLNRSLEQRTDKRPIMSDLRESGAIEQDADLISFIYRDEVYNEESPDKGKAEIIVAKQRNGPIFKTNLTFLGECTRFENYIPDSYTM